MSYPVKRMVYNDFINLPVYAASSKELVMLFYNKEGNVKTIPVFNEVNGLLGFVIEIDNVILRLKR